MHVTSNLQKIIFHSLVQRFACFLHNFSNGCTSHSILKSKWLKWLSYKNQKWGKNMFLSQNKSSFFFLLIANGNKLNFNMCSRNKIFNFILRFCIGLLWLLPVARNLSVTDSLSLGQMLLLMTVLVLVIRGSTLHSNS